MWFINDFNNQPYEADNKRHETDFGPFQTAQEAYQRALDAARVTVRDLADKWHAALAERDDANRVIAGLERVLENALDSRDKWRATAEAREDALKCADELYEDAIMDGAEYDTHDHEKIVVVQNYAIARAITEGRPTGIVQLDGPQLVGLDEFERRFYVAHVASKRDDPTRQPGGLSPLSAISADANRERSA